MRLGISVPLALLLSVGLLAPAQPAQAARPVEGYANYQPAERCHPRPHAGTAYLGRWVVRAYGGGGVAFGRPCGRTKKRRVTSEHQSGRAFDWSVDIRRRSDRVRVQKFLTAIFETDRLGNEHARARRMGIMYVIWNDHIYEAWNGFEREPYLSSSCKRRAKCSATLRHRNHVHVSLSRSGALGRTSWYDGRL